MGKKTVSKLAIQTGFQHYLLDEGKPPESVRIFTSYLKITEEDFYRHFGSLRTIESSIWSDYFSNSLKVVQNDPDFKEMNAREKHLSFLFSLLEIMKPNRSFVLLRLEGKKLYELPDGLRKARKIITRSEIDWADGFRFLPDGAQNFTQTTYRNFLWSHAVSTILFWVKDDSASAKDTDIFIEKSTATAFDIGELPGLDSIVDLGKFFIQKMGFSKSTA